MAQLYFDYRLEDSESSKLDEIFMLGYDVWADGIATEAYLKGCRASRKYHQGTWHALEQEGEILSALILYDNGFNLPGGSYGIGSVATLPKLRKTGLASRLMRHVIDNAGSHETSSFYLFSDIDMSFYEKLGFAAVLNRKSEGLMIRSGNNRKGNSHASESIDYF